MGYSTDFEGNFDVTPALSEAHREYLSKFADTRRMKRDEEKTALLDDPTREAVGLPVGLEGEYFVGDDDDDSVEDYNSPPQSQPALWNQWVPNEAGTTIDWDGGEKFYEYVKWLNYIVINFLEPWGYKLNGRVQWQGEESDDIGEITAKDNDISVSE